jgi:UDP-glucose 4-epimerase
MRFILLGGGGFIGKHLTKEIIKRGHAVVSIGRRLAGDFPVSTLYQYISGNCGDKDLLEQTVQENDVVFYLAYNSVPKSSFDNPIKDIEENLPLAISVFSSLAKKRISRLVYVSSGGTIYGRASVQRPISEMDPTNPISPYGITKLAIEKYANFYAEMFKIPLVIVRPSNPYGELQEPFRGQGFIATIIGSFIAGKTLDVYGQKEIIRDYLHVSDLVCGMLDIVFSPSKSHTLYNIGSGIGKSNSEVLQVINHYLKKNHSEKGKLKINILGRRQFDVPYNVLDNSRLLTLGWNPHISFEEGIRITCEWHLQRKIEIGL